MRYETWGETPVFIRPVPHSMCTFFRDLDCDFPWVHMPCSLCISQSSTGHGVWWTQCLNWAIIFFTLDTKNSKEDSVSVWVIFMPVSCVMSFMFLWWKLRAEYMCGDLECFSGVIAVSLPLQWQCGRRVKNENKTKQNKTSIPTRLLKNQVSNE